jgi:hypothetical protein
LTAPTTQQKAVTTEQQRSTDVARQRAADLDRSITFGANGLEITNLEQAHRFAVWAIESGLTKAKRPAEVVIQLQMGTELGFSLMQSLQVVHVIDGKPSLAVEAQAAKVESAEALEPGTKIRFRFEGEGEQLACTAWSYPRGAGEAIESEPIYLSEFKHLRGKDNWKNYPKRMMKARAVGWHVRDFYAAHVRNLPTTEELRDIQSMRGEPPVREREINPQGPDPILAGAAAEPEDVESRPSPGCAHPDGFAATEESEARVCIHCGVSEDAEQESML